MGRRAFAVTGFLGTISLLISLLLALNAGCQNPQSQQSQRGAYPEKVRSSAVSRATIVLAEDHSLAEVTAARELSEYLSKVTGGEFPVVSEAAAPATGSRIYVGPTRFAERQGIPRSDELGDEEWIVRSIEKEQSLVIIGGRPRGTLYGTYNYLENVVGVRWWNRWEESVPSLSRVQIAGLKMRGEPAFKYRDLFMEGWHEEGGDRGRFAIRNRLNRQGDNRISAEHGGELGYGPPYHVHTFNHYFPPDVYFETNPEYYSIIDGVRTIDQSQLCLMNKDVRRIYVEKLREYIESAEADARANNLPLPLVYEASPNDWLGACECEDCQAIARIEESEAGPLLDFVNFLADDIRDDYPHIQIGTLAYLYSEELPKNMKPRDNVSIRLCDTASNHVTNILSEDNRRFRRLVENWAPITKNLRVWDYVVTFGTYPGLPMPTLRNFPVKYQFFLEHDLEGVFTETAGSIDQDMRDLKIWMFAKLKENPYADYDELVMTFTEGFYGPAGIYVRAYLDGLEQSAKENPSYIGLRPTPPQHRYLHLDFVLQAHGYFDKAEEAVQDDEVLLKRVRHARMPLDRATAWLFSQLTSQWVIRGNEAKTLPLNRQEILDRVRQTWYGLADMRLDNEGSSEWYKRQVDREIERILTMPEYLVPSKFADLPADRVFDFPANTHRSYKNIALEVPDEETETGTAMRLEFPTRDDVAQNPVERYQLPMKWGVHDQAGVIDERSRMIYETGKLFLYEDVSLGADKERAGQIDPDQVSGPGYHWYKMGTFPLSASDFVYLFWSWIVQFDIGNVADPSQPERLYEIWGRIKFEGPAFPHGSPDDQNAINIERLVIVDVTE